MKQAYKNKKSKTLIYPKIYLLFCIFLKYAQIGSIYPETWMIAQ